MNLQKPELSVRLGISVADQGGDGLSLCIFGVVNEDMHHSCFLKHLFRSKIRYTKVRG